MFLTVNSERLRPETDLNFREKMHLLGSRNEEKDGSLEPLKEIWSLGVRLWSIETLVRPSLGLWRDRERAGTNAKAIGALSVKMKKTRRRKR